MKEVKEILLLISHEHKRYAKTNRMQHYFTMMRPITIIPAVGDFLSVDWLYYPTKIKLTKHNIYPAHHHGITTIHFGSGMAMNDCSQVL